jgi:hypothetical protein
LVVHDPRRHIACTPLRRIAKGETMNHELLLALGHSLALTLAFEISFFYLVGKRNKKDVLLVMMVNILTNPVVVLLYWLAANYTDWNTAIVKIPLELFAILTEGYYYKRRGQSFNRPFLFSFAANAYSFFLGVLLQKFMY